MGPYPGSTVNHRPGHICLLASVSVRRKTAVQAAKSTWALAIFAIERDVEVDR
jgi:hypothetical protein